jgi:hypothetical protein
LPASAAFSGPAARDFCWFRPSLLAPAPPRPGETPNPAPTWRRRSIAGCPCQSAKSLACALPARQHRCSAISSGGNPARNCILCAPSTRRRRWTLWPLRQTGKSTARPRRSASRQSGRWLISTGGAFVPWMRSRSSPALAARPHRPRKNSPRRSPALLAGLRANLSCHRRERSPHRCLRPGLPRVARPLSRATSRLQPVLPVPPRSQVLRRSRAAHRTLSRGGARG